MSPNVSHVPRIPGEPPSHFWNQRGSVGLEADIKSQTRRNEAGDGRRNEMKGPKWGDGIDADIPGCIFYITSLPQSCTS